MSPQKRLKILPLCSLILTLIGCGKKTEETVALAQGQTTANISPEIVLEASISNSTRTNGVFTIPRSGDLILTANIAATEGSANGYSMKVFVNKVGNAWEFYCVYKGVTNPSTNHYLLDKCYDIDGLDLGLNASNITLFSFPLDSQKTIEMTMVTGPARTKNSGKATFTANWKL